MGILDKIKGIFSEKPKVDEKPQQQDIPISKLEAWFAAKEADIMRGTGLVLDSNKQRFMNAINQCEQSCAALKSASPRYPQLYDKNKAVAEGNRASFATATENLLKTFRFPDSVDDFSAFIQNSNSALGEFMSSSNRSFIISNEFFTEQTANIKKCLHELDKVLQALAAHHREKKLAELPIVKDKIEKLVQKLGQSEKLKAELKETETRLNDIQAQIEKAKHSQSELLQSQACLARQKLESELKEAKAKTKMHADEMHSTFELLEAPLHKVVWDNPSHKKLVERYLEDAPAAISQDKDFKLADVLAKLRVAIETGQIFAKDKRRGLVLESIDRLTKDYLQAWLASHDDLKIREFELQTQIGNSEATLRECELKNQTCALEREQEALIENQASLVRSQKRTDIDTEIAEVSSSLSSLLGMQIKIHKE
ncbi:MAG: hypothetical protein V1839_00560 [archaeon]